VLRTASVPAQLEDFDRDWVAHPEPGIDLCALPCGVVDDALRAAGRETYETFFESSQVIPPDEASAGLDAAEEVPPPRPDLVSGGWPYPARSDDGNHAGEPAGQGST
jgi:hypothetical protein